MKDQVGGGIALEKAGSWILGEREDCHLFYFLFVLYLEKPFNDGIQQQLIRVLVERHGSYR